MTHHPLLVLSVALLVAGWAPIEWRTRLAAMWGAGFVLACWLAVTLDDRA